MRTTLRMRRAALVFTAIGALALSGCGGGEDGKDTKSEKSGSGKDSPSSVTLPKLDGEKISVAAVWTGPEQANFTKVLDEFEKRTGATVTFVPAQDPIVNFLGTKIAGASRRTSR